MGWQAGLVIPEAAPLRDGLVEPLRSAFDRIYLDLVVAGGCDPSVEATSITFACNGATVALVAPRDDVVEVALALPSDHEGSGISAATHLGSPETPVSVEVRTEDELEQCLGYVREAVERVRAEQQGGRPPHDPFTHRTRR